MQHDWQEHQRKKEGGNKTSFTTSFEGTTCDIQHFSVTEPNSKLRDCPHFLAVFDKNYSREHIQNYTVLLRTRQHIPFWNKTRQHVLWYRSGTLTHPCNTFKQSTASSKARVLKHFGVEGTPSYLTEVTSLPEPDMCRQFVAMFCDLEWAWPCQRLQTAQLEKAPEARHFMCDYRNEVWSAADAHDHRPPLTRAVD